MTERAPAVQAMLAMLVAGDTDALKSLERVPQEEIASSANGIELVVDARAVADVLRRLSTQSIDARAAQRWASFVRRGFFEGRSAGKGVKSVRIEYDEVYEDAIAEAISRMDEIGDSIDGNVPDKTETELILYSLGYLR
jgi:hypothetical protein